MCDELQIARRGVYQMQGSLGAPLGDYPAANWGILDAAVKNYWQNVFRVRSGEEWMMYSGRLIPDSYMQDDATNDLGATLDEGSIDADYIAEANKPFFDLGFKHFGLDFTGYSNTFTDLVQTKMPWLGSSKIFQEAYPILNVGPGDAPGGIKYALDLPSMRNRRYLAIAWAFNQVFDPNDEWVVPDTAEYEVHTFVRGDEVGGTRYYDSLVDRGFIVGPATGCPRWVIDWHKKTYAGGSGHRRTITERPKSPV